MNYYKASFQYDGTGYSGFQWQKDKPTIQSEINLSIQQIFKGKFSTVGTSRTDSGVHALDQIIRINCDSPLDLPVFFEQFKSLLPPQIRCLSIIACGKEFNPPFATYSKEYRYYFTNKTEYIPDERRYISNVANPLNFELMQNCVQSLVGFHDFCNFYSEGSNVRTTQREVFSCELSLVDPRLRFAHLDLFQIPQSLESCYELKIEARGFLKQMIRHLVSAIWMVGSEKISQLEFSELLNGPKKEKRIWKPAPARGLYLWKIRFPDT